MNNDNLKLVPILTGVGVVAVSAVIAKLILDSRKKVKKTTKYLVDTDFLPAKPTLFQRPQTYQDIIDSQMKSWAAKQAAKQK